MDMHILAKNVAGILREQHHHVQLVDGKTPILHTTILGQEVIGFCFPSFFEVCERIDGCTFVYKQKPKPTFSAAAALMVAAAEDMTIKARKAASDKEG
jgi:hypothetical protein